MPPPLHPHYYRSLSSTSATNIFLRYSPIRLSSHRREQDPHAYYDISRREHQSAGEQDHHHWSSTLWHNLARTPLRALWCHYLTTYSPTTMLWASWPSLVPREPNSLLGSMLLRTECVSVRRRWEICARTFWRRTGISSKWRVTLILCEVFSCNCLPQLKGRSLVKYSLHHIAHIVLTFMTVAQSVPMKRLELGCRSSAVKNVFSMNSDWYSFVFYLSQRMSGRLYS
jgi:hypothetical protein